jgi:hypothetical protein
MESFSSYADHDVILNSGGSEGVYGTHELRWRGRERIDVCSWVDPVHCIGTA